MTLASIELMSRIVAAAAVGALLGLDRERLRKPLGLRTLSMVSLASCVLTVVALQHDLGHEAEVGTVSRTIQGLMAGIGFLGGGVILRTHGHHVRGLTTAALVWLTAALGIACGLGAWLPVLTATGVALVVLWVGTPLEKLVRRRNGRPDNDAVS